jgi:hypothetical protein
MTVRHDGSAVYVKTLKRNKKPSVFLSNNYISSSLQDTPASHNTCFVAINGNVVEFVPREMQSFSKVQKYYVRKIIREGVCGRVAR